MRAIMNQADLARVTHSVEAASAPTTTLRSIKAPQHGMETDKTGEPSDQKSLTLTPW